MDFKTVSSDELGKVERAKDAAGRYIEFCKRALPNTVSLKGLCIVVDCANGATYHVAPDVFSELGAEVIAIGNKPDGININEACGATHVDALCEAVLRYRADVGIALDGDGDRLIMVDERGDTVDGDEILAIIAHHRHSQGKLKGGVVGTLMSNLGLEKSIQKLDVPFYRAKVGDRYVIEQMSQHGCDLGGESSGHIIVRNFMD